MLDVMPKPRHVSAILLGVFPAEAPFASSGAVRGPADGAVCEIRARTGAGGVRLAAAVRATAPIAGTYRLAITTGGPPAGTADGSAPVRSGTFAAGPGAETLIAEVPLVLAAGSSYTAILRLSWDGPEDIPGKAASQAART